MVQIRLWQSVCYLCLWYNPETGDYSVYLLTHENMTEECSFLASNAHGTNYSNKNNENKELRISLPINHDNIHFKRWEKQYKTNMLDFLFKKND